MDKQTHTPGPWHVGNRATVRNRTGTIAECARLFYGSGRGSDAKRDEANARRIVAALNAVEGIPTEGLESGVVADLVDALELIASNGCYAVVPTADDHAEAGRYTLPERTAWFQGVARAVLSKLRGDGDA